MPLPKMAAASDRLNLLQALIQLWFGCGDSVSRIHLNPAYAIVNVVTTRPQDLFIGFGLECVQGSLGA